MNALILSAALALVLGTAKSQPCCLSPDFSWARRASTAVQAELRQSELHWNDAASVPSTPLPLRPKSANARFDEHYLRDVVSDERFADASYDLLDAAIRREKKLEESKALYEKAAASLRPSEAALKRYNTAYLSLRSTLRLAVGVSRAAISQTMASSDTTSYCFQAMESGIDALRDAAGYADQLEGGAKRSEPIRKLRASLFQVWERAQKTKDVTLIGAVDLPKAFREAFPEPIGRTEGRSSE